MAGKFFGTKSAGREDKVKEEIVATRSNWDNLHKALHKYFKNENRPEEKLFQLFEGLIPAYGPLMEHCKVAVHMEWSLTHHFVKNGPLSTKLEQLSLYKDKFASLLNSVSAAKKLINDKSGLTVNEGNASLDDVEKRLQETKTEVATDLAEFAKLFFAERARILRKSASAMDEALEKINKVM